MKTVTLKEQWEMVKPLWRILVAVGLAQLVGGAVDHYFALQPDFQFTFYLGAMYATPLGFAIGLIWQYQVNSTFSDHAKPLAFLALVALVGPAIVFFQHGVIS